MPARMTAQPRNRKFLGFAVSRTGARIKVADSAIEKLKAKVRELTRRTRGHRLSDIVQELKTALTGRKKLLRDCRSVEPSARDRQMGATAVNVCFGASSDLTAELQLPSTRITHAEMEFVAAQTEILQAHARRAERGFAFYLLEALAQHDSARRIRIVTVIAERPGASHMRGNDPQQGSRRADQGGLVGPPATHVERMRADARSGIHLEHCRAQLEIDLIISRSSRREFDAVPFMFAPVVPGPGDQESRMV